MRGLRSHQARRKQRGGVHRSPQQPLPARVAESHWCVRASRPPHLATHTIQLAFIVRVESNRPLCAGCVLRGRGRRGVWVDGAGGVPNNPSLAGLVCEMAPLATRTSREAAPGPIAPARLAWVPV